MELIVISLPADIERRTRLEASLTPYGLSYTWLEGVDARGWGPDELAPHINKPSVFCNMSYQPNPGAVGCHLSHIKAYQRLLDSDAKAMIILEDDAQITSDFAPHLSCLEKAISALDIIFLCDRRSNRPSQLIGTSEKGLSFFFKRFANVGTNGYIINRKAAAYMLANQARFGLEIDMCLNRWWLSDLHIATTGIDLVTHNDMGSVIGYDNIQPVKNPVRRLIASLYRFYLSLLKRAKFSRHLLAMKTVFKKVHTS